MNQIAEIFSQGAEVVSGATVDSNAAWLSQHLIDLGFEVKRHTAVGDNLADLKQLLQEIAKRADCCICTGGLGPTIDDLTALSVSEAFNLPLVLDEVALQQMAAYFACRHREMADSNRKQALLPDGSIRIDNDTGTAPGFALKYQRCWFVFLPGVPSEMKQMFQQRVKLDLAAKFALTPPRRVILRTTQIGEADIQQRLAELTLPETIELGFCTGVGEVETKLAFSPEMPMALQDQWVTQVNDCLGDYVFSINDASEPQNGLYAVVSELMRQKGLTLAMQETASQGLIAARLIGQPWLLSTSFHCSIKRTLAGLQIEQWDNDMTLMGKTIAKAIKQQEQSDLILVQLYSGASAEFEDQTQSISLYNTLLTPEGCYQRQHTVAGQQKRKQNQAAVLTIDLLRRYLQEKTL